MLDIATSQQLFMSDLLTTLHFLKEAMPHLVDILHAAHLARLVGHFSERSDSFWGSLAPETQATQFPYHKGSRQFRSLLCYLTTIILFVLPQSLP